MTIIKFFFNPIEGRETFLNDMAKKGYRLVESGSLIHRFSEGETSDVHYRVQYIGHMNDRERLDYLAFLQDMNLNVFFAPLNIGKFAVGNIRWRPYNKADSSIASSFGMINREILIMESIGKKDVPVFTDDESRQEDIRRRKAPYTYLSIVSIVMMILGLLRVQGNFFEKTLFSFRPLEAYPAMWIVLGMILFTACIVSLNRLGNITKNK